jgi:hypothetical protein
MRGDRLLNDDADGAHVMNPCQHLNWGCPTKQSTKAGGCASQKELEFEAESEQLSQGSAIMNKE